MQVTDQTIAVLVALGAIFSLDNSRYITVPSLLSLLLAEVVKPAGRPFFGLIMNNGCIRESALIDRLGKLTHTTAGSGTPVRILEFAPTGEEKHSHEAESVLQLLAQLDVIVRDSNPALSSPDRLVLVPSRLDRRTVKFEPPSQLSSIHSYCRRLTYKDSRRRFPLGLMALLVYWLAPLTESRRPEDFAQLQTFEARLSAADTGAISCNHSWIYAGRGVGLPGSHPRLPVHG